MTPFRPDYPDLADRLLRGARLPRGDSKELARTLALGRPRRLGDGAIIIKEGTRSDVIHLVSRGQIRVSARSVDGAVHPVATLPTPSFIGYVAALDRGIRTATCVASHSTVVIDFESEVVSRILDSTDRGAEWFRTLLLRGMTSQLASTSSQLATLGGSLGRGSGR